MAKEGYITTLKDIQLVQHLWQTQINPEEDLNGPSRFDRMMEEVAEAQEERDKFDGTKLSVEKFGGEVVDVIFVAIGVLSVLGIDLEAELNKRMDTNYHKYNPVVNRQLRANGMEPRQAIAHQKRIYTRPTK